MKNLKYKLFLIFPGEKILLNNYYPPGDYWVGSDSFSCLLNIEKQICSNVNSKLLQDKLENFKIEIQCKKQ